MATVRMSHLKIIANVCDKKSVLRLLTKSGCFELAKAEDIEADEIKQVTINDNLISNHKKTAETIRHIEETVLEATQKNKLLTDDIPPFEIKQDILSKQKIDLDFNKIENLDSQSLLNICDKIQSLSDTKDQLKTRITDLTELNNNLVKYQSVNIPFSSFKDMATTSAILASNQPLSDKAFLSKFDCHIQEFDSSELVILGIVCKLEDKAKLERKLSSQGFDICTYDYDYAAKDLIQQNEASIDKAHLDDVGLIKDILSYQTHLNDLKILHDALGLELEQEQADSNIFKQGNTITIEGWVPSAALSKVKNLLENSIQNIEIESRNAKFGDSPPSLSHNSKLVTPFESVAQGYGAPTYGESDPTPVMSIFFFIFFGIMLGDAGYGLIMAIGGLLIGLLAKKLSTPLKRMILMLGICGISGVIWGLVFGGVFGISAFPYLWFDPMYDPLMMLIFSLALGVVHLLTGYTMRTIKTIKMDVALTENKKTGALKILDGLFDSVFMYLLFLGILVLLLPMLFDNVTFPFGIIAGIMIATSLLGIVLTGGRRAPSLGGKIAGGFGGLYKLINVFSDVLSYSRLFGLALASGAIAMAFNQIGMMLFGIPIVGFILGGIVLIVLHVFNFALAALAAYVHDIRLQYVEFFGKFYDGNGRFFAPLGSTTRYINLMHLN